MGAPKRHGAPVHVDACRVEAEFTDDGNALHGKRFIQFDQIPDLDVQPIRARSFCTACTGVISRSFGSTSRAPANPAILAIRATPLSLAVSSLMTTSAAAPSFYTWSVAGRDGAVLPERGPQLCERFSRAVRRTTHRD